MNVEIYEAFELSTFCLWCGLFDHSFIVRLLFLDKREVGQCHLLHIFGELCNGSTGAGSGEVVRSVPFLGTRAGGGRVNGTAERLGSVMRRAKTAMRAVMSRMHPP